MDHSVWRIGDVTITKIVEAEVAGPLALLNHATTEELSGIEWLFPDYCTESGELKMSIHALLVETPTHRFVVDTCMGNDKVRATHGAGYLSTDFLEQMAAVGWAREKVDGVICTHLHIDHVGWNTMLSDGKWVPTFPNARYYIGEREYDHWLEEVEHARGGARDRPGVNYADDVEQVWIDSVLPIVDAGLHELVAMDAQLAPGIRLMPTAGHTPGHVSVVIESGGEIGVITGDIMHHPAQVARPHWGFAFDTDHELADATRRNFLDQMARNGALVIGTHFPDPTAGRVARDGAHFELVSRDPRAGS